MQPLSRVNSKATVTWGAEDLMTSRPKVAVKIAECIAEWADIKSVLGMLLGLLLDANSKAALAMFAAVENRNAQRRMIMASAEAKLPADHLDVLTALWNVSISPVMKQRDKLAHWVWAYSPELPNDLLLSNQDEKMVLHFQAIHSGRGRAPEVPFDTTKIFVVTEKYLTQFANLLRQTKNQVTLFSGSVWNANTDQQRSGLLQRLSGEPLIRLALDRLADRRKNQEAQQASHRPGPNGAE
jgi:hypothetical protein